MFCKKGVPRNDRMELNTRVSSILSPSNHCAILLHVKLHVFGGFFLCKKAQNIFFNEVQVDRVDIHPYKVIHCVLIQSQFESRLFGLHVFFAFFRK